MVKEKTIDSLNHWYKKTFEKLGWSIIDFNDGLSNKLQHYKSKVKYLKESLGYKLTVLEENDRKRDINIMLQNVNTLETFLNTYFKEQTGGRRVSRSRSRGRGSRRK